MKTLEHILTTGNFETTAILKQLVKTHRALGEMKWVATTIPNDAILISTLALQEAKDSSEIERIVTTHDELYRSNATAKSYTSIWAKEVHNYANALWYGYSVIQNNNILLIKDIVAMQEMIEENKAWIRKQAWTKLENDQTWEIIYVPPQSYDEIMTHFTDLEKFINEQQVLDPLICLAIIHHHFESIHPFYDWNGRVGRIVNILYLVMQWLVDTPILYLSRSINKDKESYYKLLQNTRDVHTREAWVIRMLEKIEETAIHTTNLIHTITDLILEQKHLIRSELPKIYSHELINNIFTHPYTKIQFIMNDLWCSRVTATKYLQQLCDLWVLKKETSEKEHYYINIRLFSLLTSMR